MMNSDQLDMPGVKPAEAEGHPSGAENHRGLAEKFANILRDPTNTRDAVHTAILTAFSKVLQHPDLTEEHAIAFVKALVVPDASGGEKRDDALMKLLIKEETKDEPLFYKLFLEDSYFSSQFKADEKAEILTTLSHHPLPVSRGDGGGVTLLHLALSKKYFRLAFILLSELGADIDKKNQAGQRPSDVLRMDASHPIFRHETSDYALRLLTALPPCGKPEARILYLSKSEKNTLRCFMRGVDGKLIDEELDIFIGQGRLTLPHLKRFKDAILETLWSRGLIDISLRHALLEAHRGVPVPATRCSYFTREVMVAINYTISLLEQREQNTLRFWASYLHKVKLSIERLSDLKEKLVGLASTFTDRDFLEYVKEQVINELGTEVEPGQQTSSYQEIAPAKTWTVGAFGDNQQLLDRLSFLLAERGAIKPQGIFTKLKLQWKGTDVYESLSYSPLFEIAKPSLVQTASLCKAANDEDDSAAQLRKDLERSEKEKGELQEENAALAQDNATLTQHNAILTQHNESLLQERIGFEEKNTSLQAENERLKGEKAKLQTESASLAKQTTAAQKKYVTLLTTMKNGENPVQNLDQRETSVHAHATSSNFFPVVEADKKKEAPAQEANPFTLRKSG